MKRLLIMLILLTLTGSATVEDTMTGPSSISVYPSGPHPTGVWPGGVWPPPEPDRPGTLIVSVELIGPEDEPDLEYTTPGKTLEYIVTVKNRGRSEVDAEITINLDRCSPAWFSWTSMSATIPPGGAVSETLLVTPMTSALSGKYRFEVLASAPDFRPGSDWASFIIQGYDYISETAISGTGQFYLDKDLRSMGTGIKASKDIVFSGSVDALVKNQYLVEKAKGRTPNFQECDAVDNYLAIDPGDSLSGSESLKSSWIFGGVGSKITERYNVSEMEYQMQDYNLHLTGAMKKRAAFQTADNFTGYFMLDAKQVIPGQKNIKEREEFFGSFEIQRKLIFEGPDRRMFYSCPIPDWPYCPGIGHGC